MRKRTRHIAGLFALVALVFSLAEGTYALTCASEMEMGAAPESAMAGMPAGGDCMPGHEHEGEDGPDCPFGPAGMVQGCASAASLPANATAGVASSPEDAAILTTSETEHSLLLASALYHPPRA